MGTFHGHLTIVVTGNTHVDGLIEGTYTVDFFVMITGDDHPSLLRIPIFFSCIHTGSWGLYMIILQDGGVLNLELHLSYLSH